MHISSFDFDYESKKITVFSAPLLDMSLSFEIMFSPAITATTTN